MIENSQNCIPPSVEDFSRLGRRNWLWLSDKVEQNYFFVCSKSNARWHYQKPSSNFTKKLNKKNISRKNTTTKNLDLIQAGKHVCSQNWTLRRFWIDPHGSSNPAASWNLWPFHRRRRRRRLLRLKYMDSPPLDNKF